MCPGERGTVIPLMRYTGRNKYNFSFCGVGRSIPNPDGMVKVDENATVAFCTLRIDENIPDTDIAVQDTSHVVEVAMSYRVDKALLSREKFRSCVPRTAS